MVERPPGTIERVAGDGLTDLLDCNCFIVHGSRRSVLIDSGAGRQRMSVGSNVDAVLLTHLHADHAGGAAQLARDGLRVLAHEWTAEGLANGDEDRSSIGRAREFGAYPADYVLEACRSVETLADGERVDLGECAISAIETPGHSDGHLSFLVEAPSRRALIGGDLVFPGGRVLLQPTPDCRVSDLAASIKRVAALQITGLYAGHGDPVEECAHRDVEIALAAFRVGRVPPSLEG